MNIEQLDLNLLRLFSAVYQTRSVSRAATQLQLSQPAASNGLMRLRLFFGDPLFARAHGGVRPTALADQLFGSVSSALDLIAGALSESERFEPLASKRVFRMHMSDIGEARFLPELMAALSVQAPGLTIECRALAQTDITPLLDRGELDFAFGFLPLVTETRRIDLVADRYVVLVRRDHPILGEDVQRAGLALLRRLDFAAVRSHSETLLILERLKLRQRVRLLASHFLALPSIVAATDLAVVMPSLIAREFAARDGSAIIEPQVARRDLLVSLHFSRRRESDAGHRWLRDLIQRLSQQQLNAPAAPL
jgi:DNA-binding transcriptional LysR family regulator